MRDKNKGIRDKTGLGSKIQVLFMAVLSLISDPLSPSLQAASWEDEKEVWEQLSKTRLYKDPGYAAKLSLSFLPVDNGHFYVGEVGKGIWFSVGETASLVAIAVPLLNAQSRSKADLKPLWTDAMVVSASLGGFFYVFLKVWSAYSAAESARRYNRAREEEMKSKTTQGFRWDVRPGGVFLTRRWPADAR